jgi:hypothetical protein
MKPLLVRDALGWLTLKVISILFYRILQKRYETSASERRFGLVNIEGY